MHWRVAHVSELTLAVWNYIDQNPIEVGKPENQKKRVSDEKINKWTIKILF
jgi:hypothetical protein